VSFSFCSATMVEVDRGLDKLMLLADVPCGERSKPLCIRENILAEPWPPRWASLNVEPYFQRDNVPRR
jgi:hypothetical protein